MPVHAPPQPVKVAPATGDAVSVTVAPAACCAAQPVPPADVQLTPAPLTVPLPVTCAESAYVVLAPANAAVTLFGPVIVSVQDVDVNDEHALVPQEVKSAAVPLAGTALSDSVEFACTFTVQPLPPAAVQCTDELELLTTVPLPVTLIVSA